MGILNVLVAGLGAWILGLAWYRHFGSERGGDRRRTVAVAALPVMILAAGFLRHIYFVSGLTTGIPLGTIAGLGIGLFFIAPWLWLRDLAERRDRQITLIDAGYACVATALMGGLLVAI
ncbi:DUF1761 domain-containing protein [Celeribacter sp. PS-C1]|uniref:DUF1761 domain-containing protein n=1 Tax=Celeribacter sp. PS-C1 TaxID=2820813 RepID=UPI001C66ABCA|nr:DUF1761 domain-containing protein [Celeribacter sp. PS-C1]MBW6418535.1 DUF1761 domain-containing protein [Celeribacter sp. PS-C1]